MRHIAAVSLTLAGLGLSLPHQVEAKSVWPIEVYDISKMGAKAFDEATSLPPPISYTPLPPADVTKKWHMCVLMPHVKDPSWVAANWGMVEEVRRLNVKMTLFEAGGYTELNRQISQFDDCMALGADAIAVGVISEAGMAPKIAQARAKGIPVIAYVNPVIDTPIDGLSSTSYKLLCRMGGEYLATEHKGQQDVKMASFPGSPGSGWAESCEAGMEAGIKGSTIQLLDVKYGDTGKTIQMKMMEDALQTYDKVDVIFTVGIGGEAAAALKANTGGTFEVFPWSSSPSIVTMVEKGTIPAAGTEAIVTQSRLAIDMAVRALEKKLEHPKVLVKPTVYTHAGFKDFDATISLPPEGYRPIFKIE